MAAPKRGPRLGAGPAHQKQLLAGLASDLFVHGRITTTRAKAKTLRPYAEKLITKAKRGDLDARRAALSRLRDRDVVAYLFEEVAPRFAGREGGYTRIMKLDPRPGDGAQMAVVELVEQGDVGEGEAYVEQGRAQRARRLFGRLSPRRAGSEGAVPSDEELDLDLEGEELEGPEPPAGAPVGRAGAAEEPEDSEETDEESEATAEAADGPEGAGDEEDDGKS